MTSAWVQITDEQSRRNGQHGIRRVLGRGKVVCHFTDGDMTIGVRYSGYREVKPNDVPPAIRRELQWIMED